MLKNRLMPYILVSVLIHTGFLLGMHSFLRLPDAESEPPVPKVVVVGGVYVDMAVKCEQIPSASQAVVGSALSYMIAGPGANQAGEAALCGCGVQLISRIGGGPFGKMVLSGLGEFGVVVEAGGCRQHIEM